MSQISSVFLWNRIPRKEDGSVANVFSLAPNWTIEILSPDQRQTKVTRNILHCLKHCTHMGWLIDPEEKSVLVYTPPNQITVFDESDDRLPVPDFASSLQLTVSTVFDWLLE